MQGVRGPVSADEQPQEQDGAQEPHRRRRRRRRSRHRRLSAQEADALLPPLPANETAAPDGSEEPPGEVVIRIPTRRKLWPWLAALASARIPYRTDRGGESWEIYVPVEFARRARRELDLYEKANRRWPPRLPRFLNPVDATYRNAGFISFWATAVLSVLYFYTGGYDKAEPDLARGAADAARIVDGEWWRAITALTLHADVPHLLANSACLWWFGASLGRSVGCGLGWLVILLAGVYGNLMAAFWVGSAHTAVGASTASFGALAVLAVLQFRRNIGRLRDLSSFWSPSWLPMLASLALLGFLGTSPQADLHGHLSGFASGLLFGIILFPVMDRRLPDWVQTLTAALTIASIIGAWRLALR
jgi:membrane associated rhomboid family serine protease